MQFILESCGCGNGCLSVRITLLLLQVTVGCLPVCWVFDFVQLSEPNASWDPYVDASKFRVSNSANGARHPRPNSAAGSYKAPTPTPTYPPPPTPTYPPPPPPTPPTHPPPPTEPPPPPATTDTPPGDVGGWGCGSAGAVEWVEECWGEDCYGDYVEACG